MDEIREADVDYWPRHQSEGKRRRKQEFRSGWIHRSPIFWIMKIMSTLLFWIYCRFHYVFIYSEISILKQLIVLKSFVAMVHVHCRLTWRSVGRRSWRNSKSGCELSAETNSTRNFPIDGSTLWKIKATTSKKRFENCAWQFSFGQINPFEFDGTSVTRIVRFSLDIIKSDTHHWMGASDGGTL